MADTDNNISAAPCPPLATPIANGSQQPMQQFPLVRFEMTGEPEEPALSYAGDDRTPPRTILQHIHGSAVSSLTNNSAAAAAAAAPTPTTTNQTRRSESPSIPDFSKPYSDGNSIISGEDETAWDDEAERILNAFHDSEIQEMNDFNDIDDIITTTEVAEMDLIMEEIEAAAENSGGNAEAAPAPPQVEYETVTVTNTKKFNLNFLKAIAEKLNISKSGKKDDLFERIRTCGSDYITQNPDNTRAFDYRREVEVQQAGSAAQVEVIDPNLPRWIILNPEIPEPISGINMGTGAQQNFFAPTNKDNVVGAVRHNFITREGEAITRPTFTPADASQPPHVNGFPSKEAKSAIGDILDARPIDFFNLIIPRKFIEKVMVPCTNQKAASEGAGQGGSLYPDYVQFDVDEMYRFIGLLFANGVAPKPDMTMWFERTSKEPLFGNDMIAPLMDKILKHGKVPGVRRWKHFRRFLCMYDFRISKDTAAKDPLFKIRSLLQWLNRQSINMWVPGKNMSADEQTIAFKGNSSLKLRISYKKEGDGFQCDAICDRGYTYAFWFRHGDPPKLPSKYDDLKLSPTSCRVVWLALQLPNHWTRIYMDNLFNSRKLYAALYRAKALAHGVVRTSGRGFPLSVKQDEEKNVKRADALKGTTKAAVLKNSQDTPHLLAVSVYDTKPVHLMSTVSESVQWAVKTKRVWSKDESAMTLMNFLRLNLIDDYNSNMNSTDIADQLRNTYRPDHWMRNRKWWWAFFIWALGVGAVNAFKIYNAMYDEEERQKKPGLPKRWTHRDFIVGLIHDMMHPRLRRTSLGFNEDDNSSTVSSASSVRSKRSRSSLSSVDEEDDDGDDDDDDYNCESGWKHVTKKYRSATITERKLYSNYFSHRLDGRRHPAIPTRQTCQFCRFHFNQLPVKDQKANELMKQNRKDVRRCLTCNVNLCPKCDMEFHGVDIDALHKCVPGSINPMSS